MTFRRDWTRAVAPLAAALLVAASGCRQAESRPKEHSSAALLDSGPQPKLNNHQAADVQFALGRAAEDEGKPDEARAAYLGALGKDPKRADAEARLAIIADGKGEAAEAEKRFRKALALSPKDPEILCDRGYQLYLHRRWAEAEASLKAALAANPDHARSHTNLGLVLASQGDKGKALVEFLRAGCDDADARSNLALVLAGEGHVAEARDEYARALASKPASRSAREGLRVAELAISRGAGLPDLPRTRVAGTPSRVDPALTRTSAIGPGPAQ